jgi:hypothetical protein
VIKAIGAGNLHSTVAAAVGARRSLTPSCRIAIYASTSAAIRPLSIAVRNAA